MFPRVIENGQLEGTKVGLDEKLGTGLGGSVGIGRFEDVFFRHGVCVKVFSFTVDFIGADVNESLNGGATLGRLQEHVRAVNVGMRKGKGVSKRVVDVRLSSKVHDGVNIFFLVERKRPDRACKCRP